MQAIRLVAFPKCKMVSSGEGFFGQEHFDAFGRWVEGLPPRFGVQEFLCPCGEGLCRLYPYDEAAEVPPMFEVIDFAGGLYCAAVEAQDEDAQAEWDVFLQSHGLVQDESRMKLGSMLATPAVVSILGTCQSEYYLPVKGKE